MKLHISLIAFLAVLTVTLKASAYNVGICVHSLNPALVQQYAKAGFKSVRTDLVWDRIEQADGFHWEAYDAFTTELKKYKITPIFILDYGNPQYDQGLAPYSQEGLTAYLNFAKLAAERYPEAIFEVWNEPNLAQFWKPTPDAKAYVQLLNFAVTGIREAEAKAQKKIKIVGPAVGGGTIDYSFLEETFKLGLLNLVDELSIHPYGMGAPENAPAIFDNIKSLMAKYGRVLPLFITEMGYSSINGQEQQQARELHQLLQISKNYGIQDIVIYQWRDEQANGKNPEDYLGILRYDGSKKPAYFSMKRWLY